MTDDLPVREQLRRALIRQLLAWRAERGLDWLRNYVKGWPRWPALQADFAEQWVRGNRGAPGDWRGSE